MLLLLSFAFGTTPKLIWHELIADHTYASHERSGDHDAQVNLDCHADHLVVQSSFISELPVFHYAIRQFFAILPAGAAEASPLVYLIFNSLRGPPAMA
ncbi:hypothetical protein [Filimonas effusa]|uniref:hypothetical protein n=1 Tax=Filimonas effusa TaxID=2508721 RepID=UPI0013E98BAA|nr:hypothetical protein [Filimonas effusa]